MGSTPDAGRSEYIFTELIALHENSSLFGRSFREKYRSNYIVHVCPAGIHDDREEQKYVLTGQHRLPGRQEPLTIH